MRMVNREEIETGIADFAHYAEEILRGDFVVYGWRRRDIFGRVEIRDCGIAACEQAAGFAWGMRVGVIQESVEDFAADAN